MDLRGKQVSKRRWRTVGCREVAWGPHAPVTYSFYSESISSHRFGTAVLRQERRDTQEVPGLAKGILSSQAGDRALSQLGGHCRKRRVIFANFRCPSSPENLLQAKNAVAAEERWHHHRKVMILHHVSKQ